MKKIMQRLVIAFIIIIALVPLSITALGKISNPPREITQNIEIDAAKTLSINFTGYPVNITGWDNNYAQVVYAGIEGDSNKLEYSENTISFARNGEGRLKTNMIYKIQTWFTIMQFKNKSGSQDSSMNNFNGISFITVYIPKNIAVNVVGDIVKCNNGTFLKISGDIINVFDSILIDGYNVTGDIVNVKDSVLKGHGVIEADIRNVKDVEYAD